MKSLDEVIKAWSICFSDISRSDCTGCPYADEDGEAACFNHDREDALHYLKDMKNLEEDYDILYDKYWREFNQQQDNPSLTWDELKAMEGKPVWVGSHRFGNHWYLQRGIKDESCMYFVGHFGENVLLYKDDIGKLWQAYRKERA